MTGPSWKANLFLFCFLFFGLLATGCFLSSSHNGKGKTSSVRLADTVYITQVDTVYVPKKIRVDTIYISKPISVVDSAYKQSCDSLAVRLRNANLRLERIRHVVNICNRDKTQTKFLLGWLNRRLQ